MLRTSLLPGLLETLSVNTDHELPQLIFEVGTVSLLAEASETGACEQWRLALAAIGPRVDFAQLRSMCEALLREFNCEIATEPSAAELFISGRGASVVAVRDKTRRAVGRLGEVHPQVLENFKLVHPTALFELDLDALP